jgi:hypothetical protein
MRARLDIPIVLRRVEIHSPAGVREIDVIPGTGAVYTVIAWDVAKDIGYDPAISRRRTPIITANRVIEAPRITVEGIRWGDLEARAVDVVCHDVAGYQRPLQWVNPGWAVQLGDWLAEAED